jgi:sugar/nucleoside kinase (ribokinase family)
LNLAQYISELASFLENKTFTKLETVVLPDFFMDRLINLNWETPEFSKLMQQVVNRKGGSIDGISQMDINGGNAINVASALTALDMKVTPIVCTNDFGLNKIKYYLKGRDVDFSHIKIQSKPSITTALEFKANEGKVNVMIRDLGSLADFGPKDLTENDYGLLERVDYVCLFNWAGTLNFGTELAEAVFGKAKNITYYDTADPTPNQKQIPQLMRRVLKSSQVDILTLNENEAATYAGLLDQSIMEGKGKGVSAELALKSARVLAKNLPARIDLHTTEFSATVTKKSETVVPAFKVKVQRATGAGDAWNAGNILGDGSHLSDGCRLLLANAVSACYLSSPTGAHPTKTQLAQFLKNNI